MALTVILMTSAFLGGTTGNVLHRTQYPPQSWAFNQRTTNNADGFKGNIFTRRQPQNVARTVAPQMVSHGNPFINPLLHYNRSGSSHQDLQPVKAPELARTVPSVNGNQQAVLTMDNYDGQDRLVYKLPPGPGAIIAGKRRDHQLENQNSIPENNFHTQTHYIKSHSKKKIRGPLLYNQDYNYKNELTKTKKYPLKLSSIFSPKIWPFAKVFHIGRLKARGAFLSLVIMNYLGFVKVPGFPQHMDPSDVMTTFMNMLSGGGGKNKFKF